MAVQNHDDCTGWLVSDGAGARTVSTCAQGGTADAVALTLDQALSGTVLVSWGYGDDAVGSTLGDLGSIVSMPPEPFYQTTATARNDEYASTP